MRVLSAALAAALPLLVRGDGDDGTGAFAPFADLAAEDAFAPVPSGDFDVPAVVPPGSDAVLPADFLARRRRQEDYEEGRSPSLTAAAGAATAEGAADALDHQDDLRVLVVLMRFSDDAEADLPTPQQISDLYNKETGVAFDEPIVATDDPVVPTGSIREVLAANSGGALRLSADVTPWVPMEHPGVHYATSTGNEALAGLSGSQFKEGIREALAWLEADGFDFTPYEYDRKGKMVGFGVVVSHHGAEYGGGNHNERIWSHQSGGVNYQLPNGLGQVKKFYVTSAFHGMPGSTHMMRLGVPCHEIGHALGLKDLYDVSWEGKGLGNYDLMAYGKFGFDNSQYFPSAMSAYSKLRLGWATAEVIGTTGTYTLAAGVNQVYKITHGFPNPNPNKPEYLLLENRQPLGYDSQMEGGGIAIYHVDEKLTQQKKCGFPGMTLPEEDANLGDYPENGWHYMVHLVPSDGNFGLEHGSTMGGGGDLLWHANSDLQVLDTTGAPSTLAYQNGNVRETGIRLSEFSASATSMTFKLEIVETGVTAERTRSARLRGPGIAREVS